MRYHFTMVINGEDSLKDKIEEAIKTHPKIHVDLIKSFAQAVMLAFHLSDEDNIRIESFTAGRLTEDQQLIKKENADIEK